MDEIREKLTEIISEMHPDIDLEEETALVTDGILDSFDIVSLVTELTDEFDITISAEHLVPENFDSIDAMAELISTLMDE